MLFQRDSVFSIQTLLHNAVQGSVLHTMPSRQETPLNLGITGDQTLYTPHRHKLQVDVLTVGNLLFLAGSPFAGLSSCQLKQMQVQNSVPEPLTLVQMR